MGLELAALAIGGLATAGGVYEARKGRKAVEKQAGKEEAATKELLAEEEKKRKQTAFSVLKRRRGGKERPARETILTSPLGVTGEAGQAGKKLLGE